MEHVKAFFESIWQLKTDQIAIISLLVTLILFVAGKISENRIKIYETRKEEYQKLIDFFLMIFSSASLSSICSFCDIFFALERSFSI